MNFDTAIVLVAITTLVVAVGMMSAFAFWYVDGKTKSWSRKLAWLLLFIAPVAAWFIFSNVSNLIIPGILLGEVLGFAWRKSHS